MIRRINSFCSATTANGDRNQQLIKAPCLIRELANAFLQMTNLGSAPRFRHESPETSAVLYLGCASFQRAVDRQFYVVFKTLLAWWVSSLWSWSGGCFSVVVVFARTGKVFTRDALLPPLPYFSILLHQKPSSRSVFQYHIHCSKAPFFDQHSSRNRYCEPQSSQPCTIRRR